jgi:hypothetical protein
MGRKDRGLIGKLSKSSLGLGPVRPIDFRGRHLTERSLCIRRRDADHHLTFGVKGKRGRCVRLLKRFVVVVISSACSRRNTEAVHLFSYSSEFGHCIPSSTIRTLETW